METYRRDRSYAWNYRHGPSFRGPFPRLPRAEAKDFFGHRVASRIGVAAGLLLNSRWIECYSRLGFDVLTYKTVRSAHRPCYPLPNWVWVETADGRPLDVSRDQVLRVLRRRPRRVVDVTSAVCFGMPSQEPRVWRRDVARARRSLRRDQVLVVSVVGTPRDGGGEESLLEDFALCARWAAQAGAHIVEANFSCPNVCTPEGGVFQDAALSGRLAATLREALSSTPLFIKCGHFRASRELHAFYRAVAPSADAVVLVNGVARRVLRDDGRPAFGAFERAGILGREILPAALENVRQAVRFARAEALEVGTIGVGGVLDEDAPEGYFAAGAAGVVLGGAPMLDPHLARKMKERHPEW